ncbi:MAG: acyl-CoA dehydrogenase [Rhodospirillales bacterium]|nr:acyl-CoA dehydrogenase [Rhodospirillales bacterium]
MTNYTAPIEDMRFTLDEIANLNDVAALPGFEDATPDLVEAILEEAGKFGNEVLAPTNRNGDEQGNVLENGVVRTANGFKEAYQQYWEGGWNSVMFDPEYGGQGLPWTLATAIDEIWNSANMAWGLTAILTKGATEAILAHGTEEQKRTYCEKMISGEWTGSMNLTEPQAGSDLAAIRAKAVKEGDHYRISGQKIFITSGEHDMVENIIHLVLARTPDAPPGVKGISLFIAPKFMVNEDGSLGDRNDVRCTALEHKLGINGSPTCVMSYGDNDGAIGYLVGQEGMGLMCMFTMMNNARLAVGLQGVGIAERAYQQAREYAKERVQSKAISSSETGPSTIINHADVRRMLLSMKSQVEAGRAMSYFAATHIDRAHKHEDEKTRMASNALVALLTPIVKSWNTDMGIEVASIGIQVHGGMGFIEETGAAQHYRDARINAIYEGTNGIQANDLVGRKVARDGGTIMKGYIAQLREFEATLSAAGDEFTTVSKIFTRGINALEKTTEWLLETNADAPNLVAGGSVHYLNLAAYVTGGWLLAKGALAAQEKLSAGEGNAEFLKGKILTTTFFFSQFVCQAESLGEVFMDGSGTIMEMPEDQF